MNDTECVRNNTDLTESGEVSNGLIETVHSEYENVANCTQEELDVSINCFHSIFSVDCPDWEKNDDNTGSEVNADDSDGEKWEEFKLKDKITISDLTGFKKPHSRVLKIDCPKSLTNDPPQGLQNDYSKAVKNDYSEQTSGYRIEMKQKKNCPFEDPVPEPDLFFDKNLCRHRLKCPNCYFLTDNRGNLKQHMKIHSRPVRDKSFTCEICDFKTKYRSSIKVHMLRHEGKFTRGRKGQKRTKK